jgi:hypothetical protein
MAERKRQRQVRCENHYVQDRLSSQKMSQVYHWLVPEDPPGQPTAELALAKHEKDRSHLRSRFL